MRSPTSEDIDAVCRLVDDLCGIYWDASKSYLIESRLSSIVEKTGCPNYADLARKVRAEIVPGLKDDVINAVTTNETLWFRDSSPFEAMRFKLIPELVDMKSKSMFPRRFRIWSSACSTGQEPYSIAMMFAETLPDFPSWDIQILGTDISPAAVQHASYGLYGNLEMARGMDQVRLNRFFTPQGANWRIKDEIRSMCSFKTRNLHLPMRDLGTFDIIFCRNVAIYFTPEDRRSLFHHLAEVLAPTGWLFVGGSESLSDLGPNWRPQHHCRANIYQPNGFTAPVAANPRYAIAH
jgi:chemotaxis protein methyltransferase CheR